MGCVVPAELSLDLRPTFVPKTIANFLYHLSTIQTTSDKLSKLHDFLSRLEDELNKIDAFKRELPLSMLLLNDAILVLKEELEKCRSNNSVPVLEEFIPLKKEIDQSEENNNNDRDKNNNNECSKDKKNWMSSVQLWNNNTTNSNNNVSDHHKHNHNLNKLETKKREEERQFVTVAEDPFQSCSSNRNGGSAFMPFSPYSSVPVTTVTLSAPKEEKEEPVRNRLSFLTPEVKNLREGFGSRGSRNSSNRAVSSSSSPPTVQPSLRAAPLQPQQTSRKQRRCWSPELHRRFVNALQKLGGSQATPKQIRELMQVDGLTNDEVKSHLQKYRLHTRRVPAASGTDQSVVVLGGLWMPQEHYNDSSKGSSTASGSPQSPLHLATGSRGGTSPTEGDSMDDDDDEKSESYSWKSHIHRHGKVGV